MGWFQKTFGMDNIKWTPSSGWKSIQHWFTGKTQTDNSAKAQVWASSQLNEQQKDLDLWRAANLPAAQKEGYRAAGLNPILMGNQSPSVVSSHQAGVGTGTAQNPMSLIGGASELISAAKQYKTMADEVKGIKADARNAENEANISSWQNMRINLDTSAYIEALTGVRQEEIQQMIDYGDDDKARDAYDSLVQGYRNAIERGEYLNSRGHAVYEDVLNTGKAVLDGTTAVKRAFAPTQPRKTNNRKRGQ